MDSCEILKKFDAVPCSNEKCEKSEQFSDDVLFAVRILIRERDGTAAASVEIEQGRAGDGPRGRGVEEETRKKPWKCISEKWRPTVRALKCRYSPPSDCTGRDGCPSVKD